MSPPSVLYLVLVATAVALAVAERIYALRNERRLRAEGASEIAPWLFRLMAPVYSLIFLACVAEHLLSGRRPGAAWVVAMAVLFAASKLLKLWAILHLRETWTMRVFLPASLNVISSGPYRYIRHPNYLAVVGEVVTLPLAGEAWATALAGAVLFCVLLTFRIQSEEAALNRHPDYAAAMAAKGRFLPRGKL